MRHNKFTIRESEARRLQNLINDGWGRVKVTYTEPFWNGKYKIKWVLNEKHATQPLADVARSLLYLIPNQYIGREKSGSYVDYLMKIGPQFHITQSKYNELTPQQKKFFTNQEGMVSLEDRFGNKIYKMRLHDFYFYYSPVVVRDKVKSEWVRIELPEIRKYYEKLFKTGFGQHYLFHEHKPRTAERIYNRKGKGRKSERELQKVINEGLQEVFG